jgi:uncharacterized membrane protein YvbJ
MTKTERLMVYCTKCGTKNPDDAKVCTQCGASLYAVGEREAQGRVEDECWGAPRHEEPYKRMEYECFGIPRGGVIVGIAIGVIILFAGTIMLMQQANLIPSSVTVWPFAIIIFGMLIVVGALYGLSRRH